MQKHTLKKIALGYALGLLSIAVLAYAGTGVPTPSVGLYWLLNGDPTVAPGANAPLNQLGIRTDVPSIYYKSGAATTAWTELGAAGGGGGGLSGSGSAGSDARWTGSDTLGNSSSADDGSTKTLAGEAWTPCSDASTGVATIAATAACTELDLTGGSQVIIVGITHPTTARRHLLIVNHTGTTALVYFENSDAAPADQLGGDFASPWPIANGNSFRVDYDQNASFLKWIPNFSTDIGATIVNGQLSSTSNNQFLGGQTKIGNFNTATLTATLGSGVTDDWTPAGWTNATTNRIEVAPSGGGATITGLAAINAGTWVTICNTSATNPLAIEDNDTGGASSPGNFFFNGNPFAITLNPHTGVDPECATYQYATAIAGWNLIATTASTLGSVTYTSGLVVESSGANLNSLSVAAGNYTIDGAGNAIIGAAAHNITNGTSAGLSCNGTGSVICSTAHCTDVAGTLTINSGATACTVTFAGTYTTGPTCTVSAGSSTITPVYISSRGATAITITSSGTLPTLIDYECAGH